MKIKLLRKQKNISQTKLDAICNLNNTYLADVGNGKRNPSLEIIIKIAKGLNVSLSELFMGITGVSDKEKHKLAKIIEINSLLTDLPVKILSLIQPIINIISKWHKDTLLK